MREYSAIEGLPIGKVKRIEAVGLFYPTHNLYDVITVLESVLKNILRDETVALFGTLMIADIVHYLSKVDLGLSYFMPGVLEDDEIKLVSQIIIGAYGNMRGKDFACKNNAQEEDSHT